MIKLQSGVYIGNSQSQAATELSALQNILTLSEPITVAAIRNQIEDGQEQPFSDEAFSQYLNRLSNLSVNYSLLDASERTVFNVIREYLNPSPALNCCSGVLIPSAGDVTLEANSRVGSLTFEHELRFIFNGLFSCVIDSIDISLTIEGVTPTPSTLTAQSLGCVDGLATFSYLWVAFDADPTGLDLNVAATLKDSSGATLGSFEKVITL